MFHYEVKCNPYQPPECGWMVTVYKDGEYVTRERDFPSAISAAEYGFNCIIMMLSWEE